MTKLSAAPKVGAILITTEDIQTWLVKQGDRDPANTFNMCSPYYCKFCDAAVPQQFQAAHFKAHKKQLADAHAKLLKDREAERKRQKAQAAKENAKLKKTSR
jgi:hypothetical protein